MGLMNARDAFRQEQPVSFAKQGYNFEKGSVVKKLISLFTVTSLITAPAVASVRDAAFASGSDRAEARTSMFVGATYRVGFNNRSGKPVGRASVKLTGMAFTPGSAQVRLGQGLEVTASNGLKPRLRIAGQNITQLEHRANLGTGGAIAIGVGVLLVAGVVFAATYCDNDCENSKGE